MICRQGHAVFKLQLPFGTTMLDSVTSGRSVTMAEWARFPATRALIVDNINNIGVVRTTLLTVVFKMPRVITKSALCINSCHDNDRIILQRPMNRVN